MDDQPRPALVAALVEAIDSRTSYQSDWIMRALLGCAWPGGHADRSYPAASEWVRRWGPARRQASFGDDCSCAVGHCAVCN